MARKKDDDLPDDDDLIADAEAEAPADDLDFAFADAEEDTPAKDFTFADADAADGDAAEVEEVAEEAVAADEDDAGAVAADDALAADADADDGAVIADADDEILGAAAVVADDDETPPAATTEEEEEEEPGPRPRATLLTVVLCFLNVVAILLFGFLLIMDLAARQRWVYASFRYDLAHQGLPIKEEKAGTSIANDLFPRKTLDPEWLKKAYQDRGGKGVAEKFQAAEYDPQKIRPQDLTDVTLEDVFKEHGGTPTRTLEEEILRVKEAFPAALEAAAANADKQKVKSRQDLLQAYLFPLAHTTQQIDRLDAAIKATPGGEIGKLLQDAYQRRTLADVLLAVEEFRPWDRELYALPTDAKKNLLHHLVAIKDGKGALTKDRYVVKLDDLRGLLAKRFDELAADKDLAGRPRDGIEKRRSSGFMLFVLSRLQAPPDDQGAAQPLYPPSRAEVVSGIREYTVAADTLALVLARFEKHMLDAIERDRGQYLYPLEYRVHDPALFAKELTALLKRQGAKLPDEKKFQDAAEQHFTAQLGQFRTNDPKKPAEQQVLEQVKVLLTKQGVVIPETKDGMAFKLGQAEFDREVLRLVDGREQGFVGRHHRLVQRIVDLANRLKEREDRIAELAEQKTELERQLTERKDHATATLGKLLAARQETLKLANDVYRLQDEVLRAQIELADADLRNQIMERRIRAIELARTGRRKR
ncbi:MAG: hypothetical protein IT429_07700 [Gemmataceae bacterium]|nr:hypothetical protein [Gemmataceae bacterium]